MSKKIFLPILLLFFCPAVFAQNNVGLFEQCNYTGKSSYLVPGSYRVSQMGVNNDKLSSLQIGKGMRVTVYENDNFEGRSATYTSSVACLTDGFDDNVSSIVVENLYGNNNNYNNNNYVTFFNDCYSKGYSQSLKPGTYSGNKLGGLKLNISSFTIYGDLQVKVYLNNDNAAGYSYTFDASQTCLTSTYNDKIRSVVIEYKSNSNNNNYPNNNYPNNNYPNNNNNNSSYATVYTDCNYNGSSLRLSPGYYQGDKLGLLKYNISSIEIPSNLRAKVYINNENLSGTSYIISENTSCLSNTLNNRIGSLLIEEKNGSGYNNNNNGNGYNNNNQYQQDEKVILYADADFKGLSSAVLPGTYATMQDAGFITKALSSLYLPAGYRVVLYEKENFGGKTYTITATKSGFSISGWNDKAASIAIYRN